MCSQDMTLLFGPPGAGKGSVSLAVSATLRVPHVSAGDELRKRKHQSQHVQASIDAGELVDDAVVLDAVKTGLQAEDCQRGCVLDGFPRTVAQAQALDAYLAAQGARVGRVIHLDVPDEEAIRRVCGQWIHEPSGRVYDTTGRAPKSVGDDTNPDNMPDDLTSEKLKQLPEHSWNAMRRNLDTFHQHSLPVLQHYRDSPHCSVVTVDGVGSPADVMAKVTMALRPPVIYINGLPGVGKLTIASKLRDCIPNALLVHNHILIDPVAAVWRRSDSDYQGMRKKMRALFFEGILDSVARKHDVIIFTDSQSADEVGSATAREFKEMADRRGSTFFSVLIECEESEHLRRCASDERLATTKLTDWQIVRGFRSKPWHRFGGTNEQVVDVTMQSPEEAAHSIYATILQQWRQSQER